MITKLYIHENSKWVELPVYNRVEFDERLDEQIDSGQVQTIDNKEVPYEDYSAFKLETEDAAGVTKAKYCYDFDTVEKRGEGYYIHTLELVEITRIAMGIPIDGCKVTQPIEGTKKTLFDVYEKLLAKARLLRVGELPNVSNGVDREIADLMKRVISPEFHWESGTLLWECLCDIGKVIDCLPIVYINESASEPRISFAQINDVTKVYEL